MKKIITKWLLISLGIGLIPAMLLGASPGGIALTPIILLASLIIGLAGAAIHNGIIASLQDSKKQKLKATAFGIFIVASISFLLYQAQRCTLSEDYAMQRAIKYIESKERQKGLDIPSYVNITLDPEKCVCFIEYKGPTQSLSFYVTDYGDLYFSPH